VALSEYSKQKNEEHKAFGIELRDDCLSR